MRKYVVHTIGLVATLAIFVVLATGCSRTQSKGRDAEQAGQGSSSAANQTVEGCIVRAEQGYYIQPASGEKTKLNPGSQDLSAHVGHNVRVSGSASDTGTPTSTGATGMSPGGKEPELMVTKVDVVAETCPVDIQKKIDADKDKSAPK
jgi:hypothetical protein